MNIIFRQYQKQAIDRIYDKAHEFLKKGRKENNEDWKIIFRSPTGSGKTLMASKIVERIAFEHNEPVSFVWLSKGQLADQSKCSFEKYLGGGGLRFSSIDEISDNEIKENEILFTNWEKLFTKSNRDNPAKDIKSGDYTNIFMRNNEHDRNLIMFCDSSRKAGRKIVLIIDESHLSITNNTLEIIESIIQPDLRIDITATPKDINYDYGDRPGEFVALKEVRDQEMIKKEVVINANLEQETINESEEDGDTVILKEAIRKRNEIEQLYKNEGSNIKPLVLIQLPNNNQAVSTTDKQKIDYVEQILMSDEYDVNYENGRLAKWLSDKADKINLENIKEIDSNVEFLIFKQAIATGWDCPRAHILVKFRETRSQTFEIQTVGRIMRMPEFKHYENNELNRAYVYANLDEINIEESAFDYIKTQQSKRLSNYKDINLSSLYLQRSEYNDLMYDYRKFFFEEFIKTIGGKLDEKETNNNLKKFKSFVSKTKKKIDFNTSDLSESLLLDLHIDNIDSDQDIESENTATVKKSAFDTENSFMHFLSQHTGGFQQARSKSKIKASLYQTFEKYLGMTESRDEMQKIVLHNQWFFIDVIDSSITKYAKTRKKKAREEKVNENWNVPIYEFLPKNHTEKKMKKCIVQPFYAGKYNTENGYINNYLEIDENIEWWYQSGEKNEIYFGILYLDDNGKKNTFYPDFIVQYTDGRIGIFDTKKGSTAENRDTEIKANVLSRYIESENKKGKKLFGGIVVPDDKNENFKLNENTKHKYSYPEGDWLSL